MEKEADIEELQLNRSQLELMNDFLKSKSAVFHLWNPFGFDCFIGY